MLPIDRAGWPFIAGALVLALIAFALGGRVWAVPPLILTAFMLFFFRDPDRRTPADARLVVSPADGRVMLAGGQADPGGPAGSWQQITIFLSPTDVHVNRAPVAGTVTKVTYQPGQFLPAYRRESGAVNERTEIWVDHDGTPIVFRQVVGILARRIVCRIQAGETIERGQRIGVMKFGSRMDVFLPLSATLRVKAGDRVVAGETPLAVLAQ